MTNTIELSFQKLNKSILTYYNNNKDDSPMRDAREFFSSFINSTRQLEKCVKIEDLLRLLRRRGFFNPYDRNTLRIFVKFINDENYEKLVSEHYELLNSSEAEEEEPVRNIYGKELIIRI